MKVYNKQIGSGEACFVIAEIGHNHQGSIEKALLLVEQAAKAGASAVKFQKRNNKELYTQAFFDSKYESENAFGTTYGQHREALELSCDDLFLCREKAHELGLAFVVTPFDFASVEQCEALQVDAYKIASGDVTNHGLLKKIAEKGRPVIMSTGGSSLEEIEAAIRHFKGLDGKFCLLYAVSIYPTPREELNLKKIVELKQLYPRLSIGYSCHFNGNEAALTARLLGAEVVEKHFTFDKGAKGSDHSLSATEVQLTEMIYEMQRLDTMMGQGYSSKQEKNKKERRAIEKLGKGIYASQTLAADTVIEKHMLVVKSPANNCPPYLMESILGKKLKRQVEWEECIDLSLFF